MFTYREHEFFWERYLHQQEWEIHLQIKLNPWIEEGKDGNGTETTIEIDWTTAQGEAALAAAGIPVKTRRLKPKD